MDELTGLKFSSFDDAINDLYNWYDSNKKIIEKDKMSLWRKIRVYQKKIKFFLSGVKRVLKWV